MLITMKTLLVFFGCFVAVALCHPVSYSNYKFLQPFDKSLNFFEDVSPEEMERRTNFPELVRNANGLPEGTVLVDGDLLINEKNIHLWKSGQYMNMVNDQTWGNYPLWKNPIYIGIEADIQKKSPTIYKYILDSINEIMSNTCLIFIRIYSPIKGPYMMIRLSGGRCYTTFGQQFRFENTVSLGEGCTRRRTPAHELMHGLGRFHEQSREDRDQYIRVIYNNIDCPDQYDKRSSKTFGLPYDYYSVMHYSFRSCTTTGGATMEFPATVDVNKVGLEEWLTKLDIENVNKRYCSNKKNKKN